MLVKQSSFMFWHTYLLTTVLLSLTQQPSHTLVDVGRPLNRLLLIQAMAAFIQHFHLRSNQTAPQRKNETTMCTAAFS